MTWKPLCKTNFAKWVCDGFALTLRSFTFSWSHYLTRTNSDHLLEVALTFLIFRLHCVATCGALFSLFLARRPATVESGTFVFRLPSRISFHVGDGHTTSFSSLRIRDSDVVNLRLVCNDDPWTGRAYNLPRMQALCSSIRTQPLVSFHRFVTLHSEPYQRSLSQSIGYMAARMRDKSHGSTGGPLGSPGIRRVCARSSFPHYSPHRAAGDEAALATPMVEYSPRQCRWITRNTNRA
ncbi:hypothetical protein DAEQUDRAFT_183513 [Daedalea quercina L-15889]|uniref:Uncharacterized protein n=1 Tax=Daedalea quercina L-15889 TaxID=1314783 RepID=A0A165RFN4_9APHY|nr:hypothetical protein DAEQUDRAFT_183513 [Daedalea quercina L-15889]